MGASAPWQFELEVHPPGWRFPPGESWVAGRIRPRQGLVITDVRARLHERVILGLSALPHPGWEKTSDEFPGQPRPGFSFLFSPQAGANLLRLEVRDSAGTWTEFFRTRITASPDAPPPARIPMSPSLGLLATTLLRRRMRAPRCSWAALADDLMAEFVAEPLNARPNPPFLGALEEPDEFGRQRYGRTPVTGWLAHPSVAITRISAVIDPLPAVTILRGPSRSDLGSIFPQLGDRTDAAFAGEIPVPPGTATPVLLKIFAELENGELHLAFAQRFTPRLHGDTGKMPALTSGFDFVRAVQALRRAAERHALSRRGLVQAARSVWSGYSATPAYRPKKKFRTESGLPHRNATDREGSVGDSSPANRIIAPADEMFTSDPGQYFELGREALVLVQDAAAKAGCPRAEAILDLPCGHGRVARWLRDAYPESRLIVSDVRESGVAFCVEHFRATGVPATVDGRHWEALPGPYDIIWCGSLLTHLDRVSWIDHLRRFSERLAPCGALIFTTHGLLALDRLQSGEKDYGLDDSAVARLSTAAITDGFGYVDYPECPGYGISMAQPGWILELLAHETDLQVLGLREGGWDQHQDVVTCTRRPSGPTNMLRNLFRPAS